MNRLASSDTIERGFRRLGRGRIAMGCVVAAGALLLLLGWVLGPPPSLAASCISFGNRFAGYYGYTTLPQNWNETPEGIGATNRVRLPAICSGDLSANSVAWVMIADRTAYARWAQVGYWTDAIRCTQRFSQWTSSPNVRRTDFRPASNGVTCITAGSDLQFLVRYTGSAGPYPPCNGGLSMTAQGWGTIATTPFDPWCTYYSDGQWQGPWSFEPQYFGETNYGESDVPGLPGAVANFFSLLIQSVDTGQYRGTPCYLWGWSEARYHASADSCTNMWIWTQ
jgi:hypothetical protein